MTRLEQLKSLVADTLESQTQECVVPDSWPRIYGYVRYFLNYKSYLAHRYACATLHGPPSDDRPFAAHKCGNRACVNPHHLYWATAKENAADRTTHGTTAFGERNGNVVFSDLQIEEIKNLYAAGGVTQKELALRYSTSKTIINRVLHGKQRPKSKGPIIDKDDHRNRGVKHPISKLTDDDVRLILRRRALHPRQTLQILANEFGVSLSLVSLVALRRIWLHVTL